MLMFRRNPIVLKNRLLDENLVSKEDLVEHREDPVSSKLIVFLLGVVIGLLLGASIAVYRMYFMR